MRTMKYLTRGYNHKIAIMILKQQQGYKLAMMLVLFFTSLQVFAIDERYASAPLEGKNGQFKKDSIRTVRDTVFFNSALKPLQTTYGIRNYITVKLDEFSLKKVPDVFGANVEVQIKYYLPNPAYPWQPNETVMYTMNQTFAISYNKNTGSTYTARQSYQLGGAVQVEAKIVNITATNGSVLADFDSVLVMENELVVNREYSFSCSNNYISTINKSVDSVAASGELFVFWNKERAADEYDLEWSFIDSAALVNYQTNGQPDAKKIFRNNATRVSITREYYKIPLLYDSRGTLYYRVRPVQVKYGGQRLEARWSSENTNGSGLGNYDFTGHETTLNWQATTTYAEEGKRKSVVQYFDGSLRGRQTVTKDNTTDSTVVAETFYDYQGRPVIQVLPAPSLSRIIAYTPNFNVDINGAEYDRNKYDGLMANSNYCLNAAAPMGTQSGSSKYYSANNPNVNNGYNRYIPDAKNYPFTETRYMQDNTGRILAQGGVGRPYQLDSSHATKYYYGSADQEDIDGLFGTEAGNYTHYFKNMVRDANGQYSVSYVDMHGRTIATALAGNVPASVGGMDSYRNLSVTKKLLDKSNNIVKGTVIESAKTLLVTQAGSYQFNYSLNADTLKAMACSNGQNLCYDCLYDLEITITDDCNNENLPGLKPYVITRRNFTLGQLDTLCNTPALGMNVSETLTLAEGSYLVTKRLSVSRYAMDYYRDSIYMRNAACKTLEDFVQEQRTAYLQQIQCYPTCSSCLDSLGTWDSYRQKFMVQNGIATADTAAYQLEAYNSYVLQQQECAQLCTTDNGLHKSMRQQFLADVTAPYGQYANPDIIDANSIFRLSKEPGVTGGAVYTQVSNYTDALGKPDVVVTDAGNKKPQELSPGAFITHFKDSWAEALLPLHPEYCKLQLYESQPAFTSSHNWDVDFESTKTYQAALSKGYLNPLGMTVPFTAGNDPFFNTSINTQYASVWRTRMMDSLNKRIRIDNNNWVDMWSAATLIAQCKGATSCFDYYKNNQHRFEIDTSCRGTLDMAWNLFREMYLAEKREIINELLNNACNASIVIDNSRQQHVLNFPPYPAAGDPAMPQDKEGVEAAIAAQVEANCHSYVQYWWDQLQPCGYTAADTAVIFPRLRQVCKEGGDLEHIFGASTVKPRSSYYYKSFVQVIKNFNDSVATAPTPRFIDPTACHGYLLEAPAPYTTKLASSDMELWTKPDSCQCAVINVHYENYLRFKQSEEDFSGYLNRTSGTVIAQSSLDSLRALCNGQLVCSYLENPIVVPPLLQCGITEACVGCAVVDSLYQNFANVFPEQYPSYDDTDSLQREINMNFRRYMNHHLGFGLTTAAYLDFIAQCGSTNTSSACDSLKTLVKNFRAWYTGLPLDTVNCDNTHFEAGFTFTSTKLTPYYSSIFKNGVAHISDTVMQNYPGNTTSFSYIRKNDTLCVNNDFTLATRVKVPLSSRNQAYWQPNLVFESENHHFSATFAQLGGFDTATLINSTSFIGYYFIDQGVNKSKDNNTKFIRDFTDWKEIKFVVKNNFIRVYYENQFVDSAIYTGSINSLKWFAVGNTGTDFYVDWIKVYDNTGLLQYVEEFEDCKTSATNYPAAFSCKPECTTAFTSYYNQRKGTSLSFASIKELYKQTCGIELNVCSDGPMLCGKTEPVFPSVLVQTGVCADSTNMIYATATLQYEAYRDSIVNNFNDRYLAKCLNAGAFESFTVTHTINEYHYTLYYYDQAGNLVKTVPPAGVDISGFNNSSYATNLANARANGTVYVPNHTMATQYRYNSLNQVVAQQTPDAGQSYFWYDRLGRLAVSQNAKQKAGATEADRSYSYTQYDYLGRIKEVGQVKNTTANGVMTNTISRSVNNLENWIAALNNNKEQVTRTFYDVAYTPIATELAQQNLRNRVSYTSITQSNSATAYNSATFYTYDIHGNVDTLLQDYGNGAAVPNIMNQNGNRHKRIVYNYDLVSGKVNWVGYQPRMKDRLTGAQINPIDQFYHRYSYDAENRITAVETSRDSVIWEKDARYEYYRHGPLARTVLGENMVQGLDYAYTLQGWLKGINSTALKPDYDMGEDGKGQNSHVAKDVFGFSLHYYNGDYTSINNTVLPFTALQIPTAEQRPLYNGNISSMAVNIKALNQPYLYNYKYDQLNRLIAMDAYTGLNETTNSWAAITITNKFKERVSYDANGNIKTYTRHHEFENAPMDDLTYYYTAGTNKLTHVKEGANSQSWINGTKDIEDQQAGNYDYDEIGNLIKDASENMATNGIKWNVYGKIESIERTAATANNNTKQIRYEYDAAGNRIGKKVVKFGSARVDYTWYVRDAQGNTLGVYTAGMDTTSTTTLANFALLHSEAYLFGSSKLGVLNRMDDVEGANNSGSMNTTWRGGKYYEIANHLGNVMSIISDRKVGIADPNNSTRISNYDAEIVSATDYYPFGMTARSFNNGYGNYRTGFNGKENDKDAGEGVQDYGMRIVDNRLGRFFSVDPLTNEYPFLTPYQFASNCPVSGIDVDGLEWAQSTSWEKTSKGVPLLVINNYVRVKVINESTIIKDPNIIKEYAEAYKTALEKDFSLPEAPALNLFYVKTNTTVILDYSPMVNDPDNNLVQAAKLIFDDRVSTKVTTKNGEVVTNSKPSNNATGSITSISNSDDVTVSLTTSTPGDTKGQLKNFETRLAITMDGKKVKMDQYVSTALHEGGHSGGLNHPWHLSKIEKKSLSVIDQSVNLDKKKRKEIKVNFMNSSENIDLDLRSNDGSKVLPKQVGVINSKVRKQPGGYSVNEVRTGKREE